MALAAVSGVDRELIEACRIAQRRDHWLRLPWYRASRGGGAIALGLTIRFTGNWFRTDGVHAYGDGSLRSTWHWLRHLAHEVGHLPQARSYGLHAKGRLRYVAAFAAQYGLRAITLQGHVHDGAPLERQADRGRWVLVRLAGASPLSHPLVLAVHHDDAEAVRSWCAAHANAVREAHNAYPW